MSESETWVMENRDTGAGETVKRENWRGSTCFGAGASVGTAGSGSAGVSEDIRDGFTGMSGKSSSHSKPPLSSEALPSEESSDALSLSVGLAGLVGLLPAGGCAGGCAEGSGVSGKLCSPSSRVGLSWSKR